MRKKQNVGVQLLTATRLSRRWFTVSPIGALSSLGLLWPAPETNCAQARFKAEPDNDVYKRYMALVAERNSLSERLWKANGPRVGTFWFAQDKGSLPELFGSSEPVELGKKYGIYIDGPDDHHSHWEQLKRVKGLTILSPFLQEFGPDNWPRGRVLFNTALKRFEIDMSHHLHEPQFMAKILDFFRLPEAFSSFKRDPHYAKTRFTFGPEGPREQYDATVSLLS